jgi:hypothetical protein
MITSAVGGNQIQLPPISTAGIVSSRTIGSTGPAQIDANWAAGKVECGTAFRTVLGNRRSKMFQPALISAIVKASFMKLSDVKVSTKRLLSFFLLLACIQLLGRGASATTLTFNELPFQSVNGVTVQGVTFTFTISGSPSSDAYYGSPGPGSLTYVSDPVLEANAYGTLTLDFANPTTVVRFGIALDTFISQAPGFTVALYNASQQVIGVFPVNTSPLISFSEGQFNYDGSPVKRAVITINDPSEAYRFALDNLTYNQTPACVSSIQPTSQTFNSPSSGNSTVTVNAASNCSWTRSATPPLLLLLPVQAGRAMEWWATRLGQHGRGITDRDDLDWRNGPYRKPGRNCGDRRSAGREPDHVEFFRRSQLRIADHAGSRYEQYRKHNLDRLGGDVERVGLADDFTTERHSHRNPIFDAECDCQLLSPATGDLSRGDPNHLRIHDAHRPG